MRVFGKEIKNETLLSILSAIVVVIAIVFAVWAIISAKNKGEAFTPDSARVLSAYKLALNNMTYGSRGTLQIQRVHLNEVASTPSIVLDKEKQSISVQEGGMYRVSYMVGSSDNTNASTVNYRVPSSDVPSVPNPRDFPAGNYYVWVRIINQDETEVLREFPSALGTSANGSGVSFVTNIEAGQKVILVVRSSFAWTASVAGLDDKLMLSLERL